MLNAHNLSCIKQDRVLFADLSFTVAEGSGLYIKGENGAGKTSLLRILAGLSQPASGRVMWRQQKIYDYFAEYCRDLIYLGHKLGLNGNLSPVDNLKFWATINGLETTLNLHDLLADLGLVGLEDMPVCRLSAGQQRRVSLARLWMKKSAIWILDEPFNALDKLAVEVLLKKIASHIESGGTVLLTSHLDIGDRLSCDTLEMEYNI